MIESPAFYNEWEIKKESIIKKKPQRREMGEPAILQTVESPGIHIYYIPLGYDRPQY